MSEQPASWFSRALEPDDDVVPCPTFRAPTEAAGAIALVEESEGKPPRRWPRITRRVVGAILVIAIGASVGVWWHAHQLISELQAGPKHAVVNAAKTELNKSPKNSLTNILPSTTKAHAAVLAKTETILVVGSDARWGEPGGRSDTMMLVRINPSAKTISILSIPRDLRVPIPGHGLDKVNAAYAYGGEKLLIATLRDYFGVPINHFVETNFRGFGQMVDALGGVYIPVDGRYYNRNTGTVATDFADINLQPGYQKLNAVKALQFVRFRHFDSDFYRAARQQLFIREVERQIAVNKYDLSRMDQLLQAFAKNSASDISSMTEIWRLARTVMSTPSDRIVRETLPAASLMLNSIFYLQVDTPEKEAVIARWYDPQSKIRVQNIASARMSLAKKQTKKPVDTKLIYDGGRGKTLIRAANYHEPKCAPTKIPTGYHWGYQSPVRTYTLSGHPALAGWISQGSGQSILLMETTWTEAPILDSPTREFTRHRRHYQVWSDSGSIRQIAWRVGPTVVWLTNTLRNDLTANEMLAMAAACVPVS